MSKELTVGNETFSYPDQGEDSGWGEDSSNWAEAVTDIIKTVSGAYDIPISTFAIEDAKSTATPISGFAFSSAVTRSFSAGYAVYRATGYEAGKINGVYNGSAWEWSVEHDGDAGIEFTVTTGGQLEYTTDNLYGAGEIQFKATTLDII